MICKNATSLRAFTDLGFQILLRLNEILQQLDLICPLRGLF